MVINMARLSLYQASSKFKVRNRVLTSSCGNIRLGVNLHVYYKHYYVSRDSRIYVSWGMAAEDWTDDGVNSNSCVAGLNIQTQD